MKSAVFLFVLFGVIGAKSQVPHESIQSLIGQDYKTLGKKIDVRGVLLANTGSGYMIAQTDRAAVQFSINFLQSDRSVFYLLVKHRPDNSERIITDVLEIKKTDIGKNQKLTEYCELNGHDPEIFAIVKAKGNPEYYTKIYKAWRANRHTEKFEAANIRKIKRCGNESFGI